MHTRSIGNVGEDTACKFLEKNGFVIVARNYRKKWGEIDIVAQKNVARETGKIGHFSSFTRPIHFFEVKSVTSHGYGHKPEENVHSLKTRHIRRMVETYMIEFGWQSFEFHVLCVYMDQKTRLAKIKWLQNIVL